MHTHSYAMTTQLHPNGFPSLSDHQSGADVATVLKLMLKLDSYPPTLSVLYNTFQKSQKICRQDWDMRILQLLLNLSDSPEKLTIWDYKAYLNYSSRHSTVYLNKAASITNLRNKREMSMLTRASSDFIGTFMKSISATFLIQASFIVVILVGCFHFLLVARKIKKKSRKTPIHTPFQRVQRMFEFSFRDFKGILSEQEQQLMKKTLLNTCANTRTQNTDTIKSMDTSRTRKQVSFNLSKNSAFIRLPTPPAFKFNPQWLKPEGQKALWPDLQTFLNQQ